MKTGYYIAQKLGDDPDVWYYDAPNSLWTSARGEHLDTCYSRLITVISGPYTFTELLQVYR